MVGVATLPHPPSAARPPRSTTAPAFGAPAAACMRSESSERCAVAAGGVPGCGMGPCCPCPRSPSCLMPGLCTAWLVASDSGASGARDGASLRRSAAACVPRATPVPPPPLTSPAARKKVA